jgi:hypothetical protein
MSERGKLLPETTPLSSRLHQLQAFARSIGSTAPRAFGTRRLEFSARQAEKAAAFFSISRETIP